MNKNINCYLDLPYTVIMRRDDEGDYVARIEELRGCSAHASTPAEAFENLREAQRLWIEDAIEAGHLVPEPQEQQSLPSGKWIQRVPRSLHRSLTKLAERENVSLNQLVVSVLSEAVGAKSWVETIAGRSRSNGSRTPSKFGRPTLNVRAKKRNIPPSHPAAALKSMISFSTSDTPAWRPRGELAAQPKELAP